MNIAKLLKNAPEGTKLYSPIFGDVTLVYVEDNRPDYSIIVRNLEGDIVIFSSDGVYDITFDGECLLFPSKENRDWTKFKVEQAFPNNYKDCCAVNGWSDTANLVKGYEQYKVYDFQKLLTCRDAWWKMDNNWKPDLTDANTKYVIYNCSGDVVTDHVQDTNRVLIFSSEEIRDKFLETFRGLIEDCKELI